MEKVPSLDHQVIELKRWMKQKGWNNDSHLRLRDFPLTGRGVCSTKPFNKGDAVIEIPFELMITFRVIAKSDLIKILSEALKIHDLLALFLIYERHKGIESEWYNYITSLPGDLPALPWLSSREDLVGLPEDVSEEVEKRRLAFEESFVRARKSIGIVGCLHCKERVDRVFDANSFTWGYAMVNTRAVHVDPDIISPGPILLDGPNMALCPYLDMFNHSDRANTSAEFDRSSNTYKLITLTPYKKNQQIFISYGSHDNTKLLCEYGFFIPGNRLDVFNFSFEKLKVRMDARQYRYVKEKNFDRDLNVSLEGISFNLKALLYVIFNKAIKDWNPVIYACNYSKSDLKKMVFITLSWLKDTHDGIQDEKCSLIDYLKYLKTFREALIDLLVGEL